MFQLTLHLEYENALIAEEALSGLALAVTWFEAPGQKVIAADVFAPNWIVEAIFQKKPDLVVVKKLLAQYDCRFQKITLEKLPATDWLKKNQESFPPIRAGRFYVFSGYDDNPVPGLAVRPASIKISAATAFGTGQHATTYGCLLALDLLARKKRAYNILDMGCGTAILAMGAARGNPHAKILAADIDAEAVRVSNINLCVNHLHPRIRAVKSGTLCAPLIRARGQYDLVLANILAKPLMRMARDMRGLLKPGAHVVLSGLLAGQERMVVHAYQQQGLRFIGRIRRDGWHSLILRA